MGTYLTVQFKNRKAANAFNSDFIKKFNEEGFLAETIDVIKLNFDETSKDPDEVAKFERNWGVSFTFKNLAALCCRYWQPINSLKVKISSYEDEDMKYFHEIYKLVHKHQKSVILTKEWKRFVKDIIGKKPTTIDKKFIELEKDRQEKKPEKLPVGEQRLYNEKM